jgi:hypothetical protein
VKLTFVHDGPGFERMAGEWNDLLVRGDLKDGVG